MRGSWRRRVADRNLNAAMRRRAVATPQAPLVCTFTERHAHDGEPVVWHTAADVDLRARRIASSLLGGGRPGDRVLLLHPPGFDFVAAFYGCLYSGMIAVPAPSRPRPTSAWR